MIAAGKHHENIEGYAIRLVASGRAEAGAGTPEETWTITTLSALKSAGRCLTAANGCPEMEACTATHTQQWKHAGDLIGAKGGCLTAVGPCGKTPHSLSIEPCGHNQRNQIRSPPELKKRTGGGTIDLFQGFMDCASVSSRPA